MRNHNNDQTVDQAVDHSVAKVPQTPGTDSRLASWSIQPNSYVVLEGPLEEIKAHDRDGYILPYQLAFQVVTTAKKRRSPFRLVALKRTAAYLATVEGDGEGALSRRRDSGLGGGEPVQSVQVPGHAEVGKVRADGHDECAVGIVVG